jgi:hypothetical protein
VGVSVGKGAAADVGGTAGVDGEAPCPLPQADRNMEISIKREILVNILFIFHPIICFTNKQYSRASPV